jgi:hypothetical protein
MLPTPACSSQLVRSCLGAQEPLESSSSPPRRQQRRQVRPQRAADRVGWQLPISSAADSETRQPPAPLAEQVAQMAPPRSAAIGRYQPAAPRKAHREGALEVLVSRRRRNKAQGLKVAAIKIAGDASRWLPFICIYIFPFRYPCTARPFMTAYFLCSVWGWGWVRGVPVWVRAVVVA